MKGVLIWHSSKICDVKIYSSLWLQIIFFSSNLLILGSDGRKEVQPPDVVTSPIFFYRTRCQFPNCTGKTHINCVKYISLLKKRITVLCYTTQSNWRRLPINIKFLTFSTFFTFNWQCSTCISQLSRETPHFFSLTARTNSFFFYKEFLIFISKEKSWLKV